MFRPLFHTIPHGWRGHDIVHTRSHVIVASQVPAHDVPTALSAYALHCPQVIAKSHAPSIVSQWARAFVLMSSACYFLGCPPPPKCGKWRSEGKHCTTKQPLRPYQHLVDRKWP